MNLVNDFRGSLNEMVVNARKERRKLSKEMPVSKRELLYFYATLFDKCMEAAEFGEKSQGFYLSKR